VTTRLPRQAIQNAEPRNLPPLPRRDPTKAAGKYDSQRKVCWVEHMLVVPADDKLAADRIERYEGCDRKMIRTK
jgi:hypothetical protein